MVDTGEDKESIVRRLRGSRRTLAVVGLVLFALLSAGLVAADHELGPILTDDFEDQEAHGWSGGYSLDNTGYDDEEWSMHVSGSSDATLGDVTKNLSDTTIRFRVMADDAGNAEYVLMKNPDNINDGVFSVQPAGTLGPNTLQVIDDSGNVHSQDFGNSLNSGTWYEFKAEADGNTYRAKYWESGTEEPDQWDAVMTQSLSGSSSVFRQGGRASTTSQYMDWYRIGGDVSFNTISGTVTDQNNNPIDNVSVSVESDGEETASGTTNEFGDYEIEVTNGTYNVTASKDGYYPQTETVTVEGESVTQDFQLRNRSEALTIDTRSFLEHGQSAPYSVVYESTNETSGRLTREDVTGQSTVMSGDTSAVTVNQEDQEIVATSDTSVNNRTYIEAEYSTGGETYTARKNVTVANETVDNLDILPPVQRFTSSLSGGTDANPNDKTIMLLIIGAAAGAAASLIATSFAGVAALTMVMMLGWIMGMLGNGMAIVTVFIALFVGLNVAGNVDYTVRR